MNRRFGTLGKLLSILLAVTLLAGGAAAQCVASAADSPSAMTRNDAGLTDTFLEYLADNVKKGAESVDVSSYGLAYSTEIRDAITSYLLETRSELFLLDGAPTFSFYSTGELVRIKFHYQYSVAEYAAMMKKAEAAADKLLSGIVGNSDLTEVQKALLLHDRLAVHCEYDRGVKAGKSPAPNARNIYGPLVERSGVCDGYTRTYIYLLSKVGIRSVMNRSDRLNHSWNIVYIGGKPYHVDVTFDDPTYDMTGRVLHENFLLSSDGLYQNDHEANDYDTAPSDTRFDNYFWRNSQAAFVLAQGKIYYIDSVKATLNRYDRTKVLDLSDDWDGWYMKGEPNVSCFARSASDGSVILYTDKKSVYRYDPASGKTDTVFTPTASGDKMIFGMALEDGRIVCDFTDSLGNYAQGKDAMRVTKAFAAHTHTWDAGKVTKAPTCAAAGEKTYTCTGCSATKKEAVAKLTTHTWDGGKVTRAAAVGAAGEKTYVCKVCGATKKETIPPLEDQKPVGAYRTGDVNGDGNIGPDDARLALRASVKLENYPAGSAAFTAADADHDGSVSSADARLILRASVGLEQLK